jgi:hypothetical protein
MTILSLLVALILMGVAFWAIKTLASTFGIPAQVVVVIQVLLVVLCVLWILGALGMPVPGMRLR